MAITIDGTGSITGLTAGGLPDGSITTDDIAANAVTYAKIGTTEQGQLCKAWVNFDGTGTVAIRASYNVSSITDNGTGDYTVTFTSALADANYCATQNTKAADTTTRTTSQLQVISKTINNFRVLTQQVTPTATDHQICDVAIFR